VPVSLDQLVTPWMAKPRSAAAAAVVKLDMLATVGAPPNRSDFGMLYSVVPVKPDEKLLTPIITPFFVTDSVG
jgi:hypothetical protein